MIITKKIEKANLVKDFLCSEVSKSQTEFYQGILIVLYN